MCDCEQQCEPNLLSFSFVKQTLKTPACTVLLVQNTQWGSTVFFWLGLPQQLQYSSLSFQLPLLSGLPPPHPQKARNQSLLPQFLSKPSSASLSPLLHEVKKNGEVSRSWCPLQRTVTTSCIFKGFKWLCLIYLSKFKIRLLHSRKKKTFKTEFLAKQT